MGRSYKYESLKKLREAIEPLRNIPFRTTAEMQEIMERNMKTIIVTDEQFNGKDQFKIYKVDDNGERLVEFDRKTGDKKLKKPALNIGLPKVKLILANIPELERFVKDQESK